MLGIKYEQRVINDEIYKRLGVNKLYKAVVKRQLEWVGHICRRHAEEPLKKFDFYQLTHGKNNPGQQPIDFTGLLNNGSRDKKYFNLLDIVDDTKNDFIWKRIVLAYSKAAE